MSKRKCPSSLSLSASSKKKESEAVLSTLVLSHNQKGLKTELDENTEEIENEKDSPAGSSTSSSTSGQKQSRSWKWKHITRENLNLDYIVLYDRTKASELLARCEAEIIYNVGQLAQVRLFGKWIDIPRKQVAFGDAGLTYTFSGNTVPAKPWTPLLLEMRDEISKISGFDFNFVLVNRYKDGNDYMGEHKDDEKDLCPDCPIASLSLGQTRDFIFRHQDSRGKNAKRHVDRLMIQLETGSLMLMNAPTNSFWYHSLPKRPKTLGMRLNFTFRRMVAKKCKPLKCDIEEKNPESNTGIM